nr:diguanylate cyclase [Sphingomonas sp.]
MSADPSSEELRTGGFWHALRLRFGFDALVALAMLLTALAIFFQDALTREDISLGPKDLGTSFYSYAYDDHFDGGNSRATVDKAGPLAFTCEVRAGFAYPYCGFGLTFDTRQNEKGLDLSGFDSVSITIDYRGTSKLARVDLRDKDPRYAKLARLVDKANEAIVPLRTGKQTLAVNFGDFAVADWWRQQTRASSELARPSFSNVVALEVLTGLDSGPGEQKLTIDRITFHRTLISNEAWFGGIGVAWVFLIAAAIFHRRRQIARLKRSAEQALRKSERLHRTILETSADCIVLLSPEWRIEYINTAGLAAFELPTADQVRGRVWTDFWNPDEICNFVKALERAAEGETVRLRGRGPTARGTRRWWDAIITPTIDDSGCITGILAHSRDVTADRERSEQLKWASEHDALTQLPNRRSFHARLQAATLRAMQAEEQVGLLVIDLDHFKHINDSFGHSAGDELLKVVAERLRNCVRDKDLVARVGGDEFAIVLEDVSSAEDLLTVGAQVQERLRAPVRAGGRALCGGASIGGALFPTNATTAHDLFKYADTALYELKQHGRGGTKLFDHYMLADAEKMALQLDLARGALTQQTVIPLYQPKIDIATGEAVGLEALLRWRHPHHGLQLPATLEEAFNDYELAAKIGDLMQQKVARNIRDWLDEDVPFGRVSINAAPAEFLRDDYADRLLAILDANDVPANRIEIEVTEHAFLGRGP